MGISTKTAKNIDAGQAAAVASPLRIEILGLFVGPDALAISDIAALMNRSAGSLYHHVKILEQAGILEKTGTRPKGKRHEALYLPTASRFKFDTSSGDEDAITGAVKVMAAGFRMAERDLDAFLRSDDRQMDGSDRDFYAFRLHARVSPELLAEINEHMNAVLDLLKPEKKTSSNFGPNDQYVALTLALLPIKGRDVREREEY
ncbi:MAG: DNA-binding transcriptional ArsR family regulator [Limisphaerales bacterium]|jgi:DNA-binding transcriptional ArsR family regulator